MAKQEKPQAVIQWLEEYEELNQKLKEHRMKRTKMIVHAKEQGLSTSLIADLFNMQQQNVSHILKNKEKYLVGESAPKDDADKMMGILTNGFF